MTREWEAAGVAAEVLGVVTRAPDFSRRRCTRVRRRRSLQMRRTRGWEGWVARGGGAGAGDSTRGWMGRWIGRVKWKVLPWPGEEVRPMEPCMALTMRWLMARPRPVPPNLRVVEESPWENVWKRRWRWSSVMPMPESSMAKRMAGESLGDEAGERERETWPERVNLMALLTRLMRIWRSLVGSERMTGGVSGAMDLLRWRPFSAALGRKRLMTSRMRGSRATGFDSREREPASILE